MEVYWDEQDQVIRPEPPLPTPWELSVWLENANERFRRAGIGPSYTAKEYDTRRGILMVREDGETETWVSPRALHKTFLEVK